MNESLRFSFVMIFSSGKYSELCLKFDFVTWSAVVLSLNAGIYL